MSVIGRGCPESAFFSHRTARSGTVTFMTVHERPFGRYLEDFTPGDVLRHWPGKTITEYDDHLFCMITMNHHPLHTNDWFAAESVQGRNVVVGNLVYSLVLGMSVPDVSGAAIANLEVETLQHKFPTFHGDTIHAVIRGIAINNDGTRKGSFAAPSIGVALSGGGASMCRSISPRRKRAVFCVMRKLRPSRVTCRGSSRVISMGVFLLLMDLRILYDEF